jgi:uncharacterized protein (TIGR03086 family)
MSSGRAVVLPSMDTVDFGLPAQRLADLVARAKDDELDRPTPLPAYSVGDLIDHIGGFARAFASAARKAGHERESQSPGDASRLTDDWRTRIPCDLAALAQAWNEPGAWTGMTRIAGSDTPAEVVGLVLADELAVHGWDLARATGQPYACEQDTLEAARAFLATIASPDAPSGPEVAFGPPRPVADGAPLLDQVVALAGRDPAWSPEPPA